MIKVTIHRAKSGVIQSFTMDGHADFAEHGEDIVCAGASAVSFGAVNALMKLTGVDPIIDMGEGGYLRCTIPKDIDADVQERVQLLLEGMVVSLQTIEQDYGEHIKVTFKQ